ncbi:hypothetical protein [Brasilonema bromeliae]|uniref:Uncharacterized protein n=1 Tax=Brasilonema bromeliae SPC951 TaxID=385972 RepID=A0ABX1P870_9CYAN|nr:hypothetical protein [Brasilonema bromeliae]NMG20622.1 hypothetical protein [Brasilonema bromeliae SPC951]
MKNKELKIRISERRLNKVRLYAAHADKTMTQVIEELIDSLKIPEIANQGTVRFTLPANSEIDSTDVP